MNVFYTLAKKPIVYSVLGIMLFLSMYLIAGIILHSSDTPVVTAFLYVSPLGVMGFTLLVTLPFLCARNIRRKEKVSNSVVAIFICLLPLCFLCYALWLSVMGYV